MNAYLITIVTLIVIYAITVYGLNVIVGYAGQISLGHAAFFGIGAYAAALLSTKAGLSFWEALPIVIVLSGVIGMLLGLPSLRLREDFLAITTIGINFIVEALFLYTPFFGGALGIGGIPRVSWASSSPFAGGSPAVGAGWPALPCGGRNPRRPAWASPLCASSCWPLSSAP